MPELVYLKGLPGSGKTTLAREKYPNHYRVNKDDIRAMLYGDAKFSREREQNTIYAERNIVMGLVKARQNIIVDNTGFNIAHENFYRCLVSEEIVKQGQTKYTFRIEDLSSVPLHECLQRNALRTGKARVPDKVIHDMWRKHIQPKLAYPQDPELPPCIIVDVDGTIAKMTNRGPFEWDKVGQDEPRKEVIEIIRNNYIGNDFHDVGEEAPLVFFLSGRDSICYDATHRWIMHHIYNFRYESLDTWMAGKKLTGKDGYDCLVMRPTGDSRPDYIVKRELWEQHVKDKYRVVAVFDDRPSVLRLWRELGFTTFDVGPGVEF